MKRIAVALVAMALMAFLGACSKKSESGVSGTSATAGAPATAATPAKSSEVKIVATEHQFSPKEVTVTAGPTKFLIKNEGKIEHEFEIFKGTELGGHDDLIDEVEDIAPGITRELKVDLKPGTYAFACMLPGHSEQGQRGILTVT
ncbi:MAG: hypothetical protein DCC49_08620 [Acidobacteria bacterium]|nr:MAG: hypothetical protein DCC49_08620 [Acidobacteriota bacterium]